jgi:hypothetical protein
VRVPLSDHREPDEFKEFGIGSEYYEDDSHEEMEQDQDVETARPFIEEIVFKEKVATERELKVRLERKFFPWITGRTIKALINGGVLRKVKYMGRRSLSKKIPTWFYIPNEAKYEDVVGIIEKKRRISIGVNAMLTAQAPATYHAEDLFEEAFESLDFKMHGRNMWKFRDREIKGKEGKLPPNLDFIIEKNNVAYGVDVKNWIRYEYGTRKEIQFKVNIALRLHIIPFIVARYVDKEALYTDIILKGGICYYYETLLFPISFKSLAEEASNVLGYPTLAVDFLPNYKIEWIEKLHRDYLKRKANSLRAV